MAEPSAADPPPSASDGWSAEQLAGMLVPQRDRLIARLPREIASARDLTQDQQELVIDEALDHVVTQHPRAIADHESLERTFWATATNRVKRVHEGRGATVRAGWRRVDVDRIEIAAADDLEAAAIHETERALLLEFVALLTERERDVFAVKYGDGPEERGRKFIARRLGLRPAEVRRSERRITAKLDRFVLIISAGTLCRHRGTALTALASGLASAQEELEARAHINHCGACRLGYTAHVRALQSGELPRRIAALLPVTTVPAERTRGGLPWQALLDWLTRPFAGDTSTTAAQVATSGVGRGAGTVVAAKLAALCLSGAALTGGYCAITGQVPFNRDDPVQRGSSPRSATRPAMGASQRPGPAVVKSSTTASDQRPQPLRTRERSTNRPKAPTAASASADASSPSARKQARDGNYVPPSPVPAESTGEFSNEQTGPATKPQPAPVPASGGGEFSP